MELGDKMRFIGWSGLIAIAAGIASCSGCFGSRGVVDDYYFKYNGEQGSVKREDIRFGPDKYWIEYNGIKIMDGEVRTDKGNLIVLKDGKYRVIKHD